MIPSTIDTTRGSFAFFAAGDPSAPLVLLLHGFPDTPHALLPIAERAAARGYFAVAPFLRGYAPSVTGGPYDLESLVADVGAMARAFGNDRFALLGHDWGAAITYAAATAMPSRVAAAVALSVPHPVSFATALATNPAQLRRSWYMAFFQLALANRVVPRDDFAFIDRLFADWSPGLRVDPAAMRRVKDALAPGFPAPIEYYRAFVRPVGRTLRALREWPRIEVPTLHLTGVNDGCIGPEVGRDQARHFRGVFESDVLADVGHFLTWEAPDRVAARALPFIEAHFRTI